jgi:hypothetical protein
MAVSVVNGYVCFSSCDVAQAKQNKDPNAPPSAPHDSTKPQSSALADRPATILDGALKPVANAVAAASGAAPAGSDGPPMNTVDRLA